MPIYIEQCAEIGIFHGQMKIIFTSKKCCSKDNIFKKQFVCLFFMLLIITQGDVELNPGPRKDLF